MKNLIQFTVVLFLLAQTFSYSQTKAIETMPEKQEVVTEKQIAKTEIDTTNLKYFMGTYLLVEAGFELEIVKEDNKMFIITEFSKDKLIQRNDTTLNEPTRGVDLELIEGDRDALKFTQNGYETIIKRVDSK